ncbi:MAG: hypothetical protein ACOX6V_03960 [Patescibacteria group bacterium]|jgi:hypothetical protein
MDKQQAEAIKKITLMLKQAKEILQVNEEQSQQRIIFDTLYAINSASSLLAEAWKIGESHKIIDNSIKSEFIEMFSSFGRIKQDLSNNVKNQLH